MSNHKKFHTYLNNLDKEKAVEFALTLVQDKKISIIELYEEILFPLLNSVNSSNQQTSIWKEHVQSGIIRTIIENCYRYVLEVKQYKLKIKTKESQVIIVCPEEETHEMGARIVTDYFTLLGFNSTFIGASTPKDEFLDSIKQLKPNIIAISISDFNRLEVSKEVIKEIKKLYPKTNIIVGGFAIQNKENMVTYLNADLTFTNFNEIHKYFRGIYNN